MTLAAHLDAVLGDVAEDVEALHCRSQINRAREIVSAGTSADHQLAVFNEARAKLTDTAEALAAVVDWIADTTAGPSPTS